MENFNWRDIVDTVWFCSKTGIEAREILDEIKLDRNNLKNYPSILNALNLIYDKNK